MTKRLTDWHSRYVAFIDEMKRTPFAWGDSDCGPSWAGRAVTVLTGEENPMREYLGRYQTMRGALRVMRADGFDNLKELATAKLGEPVAAINGYIGDVAAYADDSAFGYSLGIVNGEKVFFRTPEGIGTIDLLDCDCVFKI